MGSGERWDYTWALPFARCGFEPEPQSPSFLSVKQEHSNTSLGLRTLTKNNGPISDKGNCSRKTLNLKSLVTAESFNKFPSLGTGGPKLKEKICSFGPKLLDLSQGPTSLHVSRPISVVLFTRLRALTTSSAICYVYTKTPRVCLTPEVRLGQSHPGLEPGSTVACIWLAWHLPHLGRLKERITLRCCVGEPLLK